MTTSALNQAMPSPHRALTAHKAPLSLLRGSLFMLGASAMLQGCLGDFPELAPLPAAPELELDMSEPDMEPDMRAPDMELDMALDMELDMALDMELDMALDMSPEMGPDMTIDMGVEPLADVLRVRCEERGVVVDSTGTTIEGAPTCPAGLSAYGREWVRIAPTELVAFNVNNSVDRQDSGRVLNVNSTTTGVAQADLRSQVYYLSRREVSVSDYQACVAAGACTVSEPLEAGCTYLERDNQGFDAEAYAMNCVSWRQAQEHCAWLGGRLPTEVEWELGVSSLRRVYPVNLDTSSIGDQSSLEFRAYRDQQQLSAFCGYANYKDCAPINPETRVLRPSCHHYPEGSLPAAPVFLDEELFCDVSGNLSEWMANDYTITPPNPQSLEEALFSCDPTNMNGGKKSLRGGDVVSAYLASPAAAAANVRALLFHLSFYARPDPEISCEEVSPQVGFRCLIPSEELSAP